ncbi:MAG: hypothetical protein H7Y05_10380 [Steroidobacteraceae bacterium]|nr:hypothetical protein [Deltaproteobacteria bacterium]
MNIFDENALDQLHELQQKRLAEIHTNGQDYHVNGSEKSFRGLQDSSTIVFPAGSPVHSGCTIDSKAGSHYVAAVQGKAGFIQASVMPVIGSIETMTTAKNGSFLRSGSLPILSRSAGEIGVPAFGAPATGSTIKHGGQLFSVVSVRRDGPISILRVQPTQQKSAPAPRTSTGYRGGLEHTAPTMAPLRGLSAWN